MSDGVVGGSTAWRLLESYGWWFVMVQPVHREITEESGIVAPIVHAIADCRGEDPRQMAPLHDEIDLEAVQCVVDSNAETTVQFPVCGLQVTVTNDAVFVTPSDTPDLP